MNNYQLEYSSIEPKMFNRLSRKQKAKRLLKTLQFFYGKKSFKHFKVLDLGCSSGIIDNFLAKYFQSVTGIDIDKKAVGFAKKNFRLANLHFLHGDALNLKFKDNSFDIIICTHIYEHVTKPQKLADEIFRLLKPGGVCYFAAVNKLWIIEPHYDLPFLSWLPRKLANYYVRIFSKADIYYETPKTYWQLRNLVRKFKIIDYTDKILLYPEIFGYDNILKTRSPLAYLAKLFSPLTKFLTPTFFWLLVKEKIY